MKRDLEKRLRTVTRDLKEHVFSIDWESCSPDERIVAEQALGLIEEGLDRLCGIKIDGEWEEGTATRE